MSRARVWLVLLAAPLVLALVFGVAVAILLSRGVPADDLVRTLAPLAPLPVCVAFSIILALTLRAARRDALAWRDLGWSRPRLTDLAAGAAVAAVFVVVDALALHPWMQRVSPSFDPTLGALSLPLVALTMIVSIVAEDTLYRGYALCVLRARHGTAVAVVVTSLGYALLAPDHALKAWAFVFGLALAALRIWRGNLWPVALAHFAVSLAPRLLT